MFTYDDEFTPELYDYNNTYDNYDAAEYAEASLERTRIIGGFTADEDYSY